MGNWVREYMRTLSTMFNHPKLYQNRVYFFKKKEKLSRIKKKRKKDLEEEDYKNEMA